MIMLTRVPRGLETGGCIKVREGLEEGGVVDTLQAVFVEIISRGYDEVSAHPIPYSSHLQ